MLALSRVFMVSNNALHSGYSVCRTCARLQGHVHIAGYRLLFIGPCVAAGADAGRDAARRAPRRLQEQASINSNECAWFVRESAFNFGEAVVLQNMTSLRYFPEFCESNECDATRSFGVMRNICVKRSIRITIEIKDVVALNRFLIYEVRHHPHT